MSGIQTKVSGRATLDDLMREPGKAELIDGRIVRFMPTGIEPNEIAAEIYVSLRAHVRSTWRGRAFTDGIGFAVPKLASGRESFSPDAAYYDGPPQKNKMDFVFGPPSFAVEVRSNWDYGPAAESAMAAKRADYFEAGTRVVWDVDSIAKVIHSYRSDAPETPLTFRDGDEANANPAVPGWRDSGGEIFGG